MGLVAFAAFLRSAAARRFSRFAAAYASYATRSCSARLRPSLINDDPFHGSYTLL